MPKTPVVSRPLPRPARHAGPDQVGGGTADDYVAQVPGLISQAAGTFQDVSPGITEQGDVGFSNALTANAFSLQINSQYFYDSPACDGSSNPSGCQAWQQFLYMYQNPTTSMVFMQYWLLHYGPTCPSGWMSDLDNCVINSPAMKVATLTASQLGSVELSGSATSGGYDSVVLDVGSEQATSVSNSDNVLDLASFWNATQWGVYGANSGNEAFFGPGTTLQAQTTLTGTDPAAPVCLQENFTGESNNLNLTSTPALSSAPSPTMVSEQTNGSAGTANCSAIGTNPALIGVLNNGVAYVKEGGLSQPWVAEYSGVAQIAVATDPLNGPLIAVLTTGGVVYAKEGSLSAPWVEEATGISQIAVASDAVNGPLIGVVTTGGVADVKEGSLSAGWTFENSGVSQLAVASDGINGPLIGVLTTGGTAYVKEGNLYASWVDEDSGISQLAVASDGVNGPLISVLTSGGVAYAKEGGLSAGWTFENSGISQIAVASDTFNGPLIGVVTSGGTAYVKEGNLSATWVDEYNGWLALASESTYGPVISVLTPDGNALTKQGGLSALWTGEASGVSQVVSAG